MTNTVEKSKINIIILYGLPGSGKTTYANSLDKKEYVVCDLDSLYNYGGVRKEPPCDFYKSTSALVDISKAIMLSNGRSIVLDGLFCTNQHVWDILFLLNKKDRYDISYNIMYWEEDRESCLINDRNRRSLSSSTIIKNGEFEEPDLSVIGFPNGSISKKKVIRKPQSMIDFDKWLSSLNLNIDDCRLDGKILYSQSWGCGGEVGNYLGDRYEVDPEDPVKFTIIDDLIEDICPNIGINNYKKITALIKCNSETEYDYYDSYTNKQYYSIDLYELYLLFKSLGINIKDSIPLVIETGEIKIIDGVKYKIQYVKV